MEDMPMLENVVRLKDKSYYVNDNLKYLITKVFCNPSAKQNIINANDYLGGTNNTEEVIWTSSDKRTIIICNNYDKGTIYKPRKIIKLS